MKFVDFVREHDGVEVVLTVQHGGTIGMMGGRLEANVDDDFVTLHFTGQDGTAHYRALLLQDIIVINTDTSVFDDEEEDDDDEDDDDGDCDDRPITLFPDRPLMQEVAR